jgi:TIR domain
MADEFQYGVFLSHSARDKAVVRELAARLQQDDVRVWLAGEQIQPGDSIPAIVGQASARRMAKSAGWMQAPASNVKASAGGR